jgi:hypothetical protein
MEHLGVYGYEGSIEGPIPRATRMILHRIFYAICLLAAISPLPRKCIMRGSRGGP